LSVGKVMRCGALAVQWASLLTGKIEQKPVASITQISYSGAHRGWMVMGGGECSLPHNPLVAGSIPARPTFLKSEILYSLKN